MWRWPHRAVQEILDSLRANFGRDSSTPPRSRKKKPALPEKSQRQNAMRREARRGRLAGLAKKATGAAIRALALFTCCKATPSCASAWEEFAKNPRALKSRKARPPPA